MVIVEFSKSPPRVKVSFQGIMKFLKDTELSPLSLWCWLRALSEAPVIPSEFWGAAGEAFPAFATPVGLLGVPLSQLGTGALQLCRGCWVGLELNEIFSGGQSGFSFFSAGAMSFQGALHVSSAAALPCSTGIPGGGADAAWSLLLFPVLSELLSPLRCLGQLFRAAALCVPARKVELQLLPCPLTQMEQPGKGSRG